MLKHLKRADREYLSLAMSEQPLVSIITPTYNRAAFLGAAIDSVLAQTYPRLEHIIVDDGSTDDTPKLMERYLADRRIKYFTQSNQGQSIARNLGIEHSSGKYICFLDSDDVWVPEKLREQIDVFARHPDVGVVYGDATLINEQGQYLKHRNMKRYSGRITARLLHDNFVGMSTTMARTWLIKELGGFSAEDRLTEDYRLWLWVSTLAEFLYVPRIWLHYRVMENQLSSQGLARLYANEKLIDEFLASADHRLSLREMREGKAAFLVRKARVLSSYGHSLEAFRALASALLRTPASPAPWRTLARLVLDIPKAPDTTARQ